MKNFLRLLEKGFIIVGLTFFTGIFGEDGLGEVVPEAVISLVRYFIWIISSILVCVYWKNALVIIGRNILIFILTALSLVSFIWSEFPDFVLFNNKEVFMMTSFGLYFAIRFSLKEQVQLIASTLLIGALMSLICGIALPSVGLHGGDHPGAWKGIYGYKNNLGSMMVLSSLAFFSLPKGNSALYRWGGFSFSLVLMLLSTSKTSLVLSFLLILIIIFYKNFRWQGKISVIVIDIGVIIVGCVALLILSYWVELLTGLGKDPTLTGRTPMWGYVIVKLMERPILGYGRGSFWAPGSEYGMEVGQVIGTGWSPPHCHNGFLDIALDDGVIGLSLFLISYFTCLAQALKLAYATKDPQDMWPLAYVIFLAMNNMTESYLMHLANIYWVLFITIALTLKQLKLTKKKTISQQFSKKQTIY